MHLLAVLAELSSSVSRLLSQILSSQAQPAPASPPKKPASSFLAQPSSSSPPSSQQLQDILIERCRTSPSEHLTFISSLSSPSRREFTYQQLHTEASHKSALVRSLAGFRPRDPVLLYLEDHWATLQWFWAVLLADGVPVLGTPLSNDDKTRLKTLRGLSGLLEAPVCITTERLRPSFFDDGCGMRIQTAEALAASGAECHGTTGDETGRRSQRQHSQKHEQLDPAILMLTSGSTGLPKAVMLSHEQILAAVKGKASVRALPPGRPFLNWIGLDHVASLVEIHIQALYLGVGQVHVATSDVVSSPRTFLQLLSEYRVSRSFAPNFFLAKLVAEFVTSSSSPGKTEAAVNADFDLSGLTVLASGGEANHVKTCQEASALLARYGAPANVITPGFGMTETCAGAIFNLDCPTYDVGAGHDLASLGKCMDGIQMRITLSSSTVTGDDDTAIQLAPTGDPGHLEVRGRVVSRGYYRNPVATMEAFTADGWFRTGDQACIGPDGMLKLVGRAKDVVNINGVKVALSELEAALGRVLLPQHDQHQQQRQHVSRFVVFPSRGRDTDQVTVAYVPKTWPLADQDAAEIEDAAVGASMLVAASRPLVFPLGDESSKLLPPSTLGKISPPKMTALFESGAFASDVEMHRDAVRRFRRRQQQSKVVGSDAQQYRGAAAALTKLQSDLVREISEVMGGAAPSADDEDDASFLDIDATVFELGLTSVDLIRLQRRISALLDTHVPIVTLMKNPTVRSLSAALSSSTSTHSPSTSSSIIPEKDASSSSPSPSSDYDPVVVFKSTGSKPPLWLIHPGVGEVLVFVGLAQHMRDDDRPIYALRARGFEQGQAHFSSIEETRDAYLAAIRRKQPKGPYALAGYSYGTMLAFEMAKELEAEHGRGAVRFLGGLNLPPHIKDRMRQLSWNMCLLHLASFLDLIPEDRANVIEEEDDPETALRHVSREEALSRILAAADAGRMAELGLTDGALARWAGVAFSLQSMAVGYEPSGSVASLDIFHAVPLRAAARSREEWMRDHLSRWADFCNSGAGPGGGLRFHGVGGAHYTMINSDHVAGFSRTLKGAMRDRGI